MENSIITMNDYVNTLVELETAQRNLGLVADTVRELNMACTFDAVEAVHYNKFIGFHKALADTIVGLNFLAKWYIESVQIKDIGYYKSV